MALLPFEDGDLLPFLENIRTIKQPSMGSSPPCPALPLRVLVFPFLARSHIAPAANTARLLAARGVQVTVVTTPFNADFVRAAVERPGGSFVELRIVSFPTAEFGLPDGCENLDVLPDHLCVGFFSAVYALSGPLDDMLRELRPDGLVSDDLYPWTTALAREHRIPRLVSSVFAACSQFSLGLHLPREAISSRTEPFAIPGLPELVKLTRAELPPVFNHPYFLKDCREAELDSYGVIFNSFYDLEPDYLDNYCQRGSRKVFLVGPVTVPGSEHSTTTTSTKVIDDRDACLQWLDTKEENSVVYLGFGTKGHFNEEQLRELALGLEACGHAFLWTVWAELGEAWMPEGYEEKVEGHGLVLRRWVPQPEILTHRAVGGYVIHCGWNSVLEAVCAGLPTATWPLHSEQFVNERLLVDVLKIGFPVREGPSSIVHEEKMVVPAKTVAKAVARLMAGGEEVEAMRCRARALGGMGRRAAAEGGSSYADLGRLIEGLLKCKCERALHH